MTLLLDAPAPVALPAAGRDLLVSIGGFAALGLCAGLGSADAAVAARAVPSALAVGAGALLLTGPALLVAHQFLGLRAPPEALVAALVCGFTTAGRAALGVCPAMLFFSATSGLWPFVFAALAGGIGLHALLSTSRALSRAEPDPRGAWVMRGLALGWIGLTTLIAGRLAWDVGAFVAGGVSP